MELNEKEKQQMRRIYYSKYGILQVKEKTNFYSVDKETAHSLVSKEFAEYTRIGITRGIRLTTEGIREVNKEIK
ncbi:hypothetical protein KAR91_04610 [Candidatus Pacearchaeota archaeon]|nr:hypothetical protein [Candidatus Pacearchaeota archaeon]